MATFRCFGSRVWAKTIHVASYEEESKGNDKKSSILTLPITQYDHWYKAIISNDSEVVHDVLASIAGEEKTRLLDGEFVFDEAVGTAGGSVVFSLSRPLCLSAVTGARDVLAVLIRHGVDIYCTDTRGYNVLHAITVMGVYFTQLEQTMVEMYDLLRTMLSSTQIRTLLYMEDDDRMRPVERASREGNYRMMMSFLETRDAYLVKVVTRNCIRNKYYDVTEYESPDEEEQLRMHMSPMTQIAYMMETKLQDGYTARMFRPGSVVHTWARARVGVNHLFIRFWFYVRMSYFISYLIYDSDERWVTDLYAQSANRSAPNATKSFCPGFTPVRMSDGTITTLRYYFLLYWVGALLVNVLDAYRILACFTYFKNIAGRNLYGMRLFNKVHRNEWYLVCNFITVNLIFTILLLQYLQVNREHAVTNILRLIATSLGIWSPLFFVQVLPNVGHFVVIIQRMIGDIVSFMIIFILVLLPFSQMLLMYVNANSQIGCVEDFNGLSMSVYTVIKVMQNMYDLASIALEDNVQLRFLQNVIVFFMSVVLLNFLIGKMSHSVAKLMENADIVALVIKLHMGYFVEFRFKRIFKPLYRYMQKKNFVCEEGRIYIVTSEPITTRGGEAPVKRSKQSSSLT